MTAMSTAAIEGEATIGLGLRRRLVGFVRTLRDNGFHVGLAESRDALQVLASPAALRPLLLKAALRCLFCATRSDWQRFDGIFEAYWLRRFLRSVERVSAGSNQSRASLERLFKQGAAQGPTGAPDHVERRAGPDTEELADGRGRREGASRAEALERGAGASDSTCAAPSIAACLTAGRPSSSSGAGASPSRCGS